MSSLLRGLSSGFGRTIGRIIAYIFIGFLLYLIINKLDINIGDLIKKIDMRSFIL